MLIALARSPKSAQRTDARSGHAFAPSAQHRDQSDIESRVPQRGTTSALAVGRRQFAEMNEQQHSGVSAAAHALSAAHGSWSESERRPLGFIAP
jgi:hypothetical protein